MRSAAGHSKSDDPADVGEGAGESLRERILEALSGYWGYDELRPLQLEAIAAGVAGRDSLVVMPTGGGKSLCYQVPPLLDGRLWLVVSPLIALMKDQVDGLRLNRYPAAALYSGMDAAEVARVRGEALSGQLKLLLVAPERLLTDGFLSFVRTLDDRKGLGGIAIDEAHCISQWGHDFRPEYRRLRELREHFPSLSIHAYTATATPRVRQDIVQQLGLRDPEVLVGVFDRPNLTYRILPRQSGDDQVEEALRRHEGRAAIVYCISRKETERLAAELTHRGLKAQAYHAGMTPIQRTRVQDAFSSERLGIVVATVAFGMGIDRSDVRCVVHASMPKTVEHYQQETGRAGRDGLPSECVMFYSVQDVMTWQFLMERSAEQAETPPEPAQVAAQQELLEHMRRLCNSARCRHKSLSEYFGQAYPNPNCGACDVCLNELAPVPDMQTVAKKIISCVARLHQASGTGFGAAHVADVLRGAMVKRVLDRGHEQLSTFGLLREYGKERIVSYINQLVDVGVLARAPGEYPVIVTCAGSMAVLKDRQAVALFDPVHNVAAPERAAARDGLAGPERALFEHLRAVRRAIAEERGVPPFLVFPDTVLEELARVRPGSISAMGTIRGVGEAKLETFGDRFVGAIVDYCRDNRLDTDAQPAARTARVKPRRSREGRPASYPQQQAYDLFARGATIEEVAEQTRYALSTTAQRLVDWIERTRPDSVAAWVNDDVYRSVQSAAENLGSDRLRPIFDHLGGTVAYEQIRVVLAHRRAVSGQR